ncbi:MAG: hypothetical protein WA728_16875 [Xanthobacteraceae bacterium]
MSQLLAQFDKCLRHIMRCDEMQNFAIPAIDYSAVGIADPNGVCQYVGKNRLGVAGWAVNKLEHLCSRTLLFGNRVQLAAKPLDLSFAPQGTRNAPAVGC